MLASFFAGAGEGEIMINLYMLFLITRILCNFCAQQIYYRKNLFSKFGRCMPICIFCLFLSFFRNKTVREQHSQRSTQDTLIHIYYLTDPSRSHCAVTCKACYITPFHSIFYIPSRMVMQVLKVPKCENFHRTDFFYFFTIKPLWVGDFRAKIKN